MVPQAWEAEDVQEAPVPEFWQDPPPNPAWMQQDYPVFSVFEDPIADWRSTPRTPPTPIGRPTATAASAHQWDVTTGQAPASWTWSDHWPAPWPTAWEDGVSSPGFLSLYGM